MNKQQYLDQLNEHLLILSREEREDILYDVLEKFEKGIKEGKSERFIINELGDSKELANQFMAGRPNTTNEPKINSERMQSNVTLILVIIFNIMFVLGPAIAIAGILFAFYATGFSLIFAAVIIFFRMILVNASNVVVIFFIMLFLVSLGTLIFAGAMKLGSWLKRILKTYIQFNKRIVKGENIS